jgi:thioredoxin-related protein
MKTRGPVFLFLLFVCAALLAFINNHPYEELTLNSAVPLADVKMKDVGGGTVSLAGAKKDKGLLVIFSCNTCPFVKLMEGRIREYSDLCLDKGIGCVIVNSNEAQREDEDSFSAMQKYHAEQKLRCYYTVDEKSSLANAFGAGRTPQCFLFDASGKLVYKGAIDDNVKDAAAVKQFYLRDAITAVLAGQKPTVQETKSIGCTIKRAE